MGFEREMERGKTRRKPYHGGKAVAHLADTTVITRGVKVIECITMLSGKIPQTNNQGTLIAD